MPEPIQTSSLREQALTLVERVLNAPNAENKRRLQQWQRQSDRHAKAVVAAQIYLGAKSDLKPRRFNWLQQQLINLQAGYARLSEHQGYRPLLAFGMLVVLSMFGFVMLLPEQTAQSSSELVTKSSPHAAKTERYRTGFGQQHNVVLDEGSIVWMDWQTEIKVTLSPARRQVELVSGMAAFKVTSDTNRPFVVTSGDVSTRVTGTEFTVSRRSPALVEVAVLEGNVIVSDAELKSVALAATQTISAENAVLGEIDSRPIDEMAAWREGLIVLREKPLIEALHAISPYTPYQINTDYLLDTDQLVSGTFFVDRGEAALRTMLESHNLTTEIRSPNTLMVKRSAPRIFR